MRGSAVAAGIVALAALCGAPAGAQAPKRLPGIAGAMGMNVLVEVDGTVKTWGGPGADGPYLGDGSSDGERKVPQAIPGVHDIIGAAAGMQHVLLLGSDGTVYGWGRNNHCELGVKGDKKVTTPIRIEGISDAIQVAASEGYAAALRRDGTVWEWGSSSLAGDTKECWKPMQVPGLTGVRKIAISNSSLALKQDGTVWGWGYNRDGELCDGTTQKRKTPVQAKGIANAVDIDIESNSMFVLANGTVWMCGSNTQGGMSTTARGAHTTPVQIPGITTAVAGLAAGPMVRLKDGTLLGWGYGVHGTLGDGFVDKEWPQPHAPVGLGPVLAHYYASNGGYAIKADGTVMGWAIYVGGDKEWALKPIPLWKVKLDQ